MELSAFCRGAFPPLAQPSTMSLSASVVGAGIVMLAACLFSFACAYRLVSAGGAAQAALRRRRLLAAFGVATLVFGCRLALAEGRVSWAPYLDQWNAEISGLVAPLAHGRLGLDDLFVANNEHRVVLTRLVSLAALEANGGWDNRVEVVAMFLLQSAVVAWFCLVVWKGLGWLRGSLVASTALMPMFLVCDWENLVSGFQDQFGLMVLGTLVALSLAGGCSLGSRACLAAMALAAVMLGAMASGFVTALAMAGTGLVLTISGRRSWRSSAGFISGCAAVAALGWFTRHHSPVTPGVYASGPGVWLRAFLAYASWPFPAGAPGFLCLWLPWIAFLLRVNRRREESPLAPLVLGLGLWVLLQAAALAWARAGFAGLVGARYTEVLAWGLVANTAAAVLAVSALANPGKLRVPLYVGLAAWVVAACASEAWRSRTLYRPYLEGFRQQTLEHEQRIVAFVRTGDERAIAGVGFPHVPGTAAEIISRLSDAKVRALLSGPMRRGLVDERAGSVASSPDDGPLSSAAIHALRNGPWIASAGIALLAGAGLLPRRRPSADAPLARNP